MELKNYNVYFFFLLLIGISIVVFFVIKPFLIPFLIAAILAHLFRPVYQNLFKKTNRKGLSSAVTCLLIALIIVIPLITVSILVINEVKNILINISDESINLGKILSQINSGFSSIPFLKNFKVGNLLNQENIVSVLKSFSVSAITVLQNAYRGVVHFIFVTFIMFFSLFYLFIDGDKLIRLVMKLSPLQNRYEDILLQKFNSIVRATLKGTTFIAIIQGFLGAILFSATGVTSPVFLGILMTVSSVIPSVGSGLVWAPVGIVMIILGYPIKGIIILLFGALFISTIDNFIRPKLVGKDTQMHPLLILFSTLGGIALFGISGFIVGPILMSLFVALWEIYSLEFKNQLDKFNA